MAILRLPSSTNISFLRFRWPVFILSGIMIAITFLFYALQGLNYGIDFKGGLSLEIRTPEVVDLGIIRTKLSTTLGKEVVIQEFGSPQDLLIRVEKTDEDGLSAQAFVKQIQQVLDDNVEYRRVETIGPKIGQELVHNGMVAVFWSLVAMFIYIWFRFEWRFGIAAFAALLQDCLWVLGLFTVFRMEFNETAIVTFLITASYSINDTVVIFDRIRENRQKYQNMPFAQLINLSINETLSRTILTSSTTLVALAVLYLFGGPVIASFSLPIFIGIVVGTYSSIFFAPPLLLMFQKKESSVFVNTNTPAR